jgi:hypothetical protein
VHKPKGVRFGPTIVYDAERCIMCTRCIRVCDELAGDHVLDMRERGNKNEITVAQGRELEGDYTLMTEHVCPVGALTQQRLPLQGARVVPQEPGGRLLRLRHGLQHARRLRPALRRQRAYRDDRPRDNTASLGRGDARVPVEQASGCATTA